MSKHLSGNELEQTIMLREALEAGLDSLVELQNALEEITDTGQLPSRQQTLTKTLSTALEKFESQIESFSASLVELIPEDRLNDYDCDDDDDDDDEDDD